MAGISRTDTSLVARWWWTIDRWNLAALIAIAGIGALMALAASPPVAERIGLDTFYFARRQFVYLLLAIIVMFSVSLLSPKGIRRLAVAGLAASLILMVAVLFLGSEIKGASRWLQLGPISLQPSEFVKPSFTVVAAWMFAEGRLDNQFPGYVVSTGLFVLTAALLLMQPDVGMTMVVASVWGVQFFLAGLPLILVALIASLFIGGGVAAYFTFPHVQGRIDRFLDPAAGESYQVMRGIEAFQNGGLFGRGPGEGRVKEVLPDAHADFIFAVTGEEFGLIACLIIICLFAFVVFRGFSRIFKGNDLFVYSLGCRPSSTWHHRFISFRPKE